jgi:hypothetical protein
MDTQDAVETAAHAIANAIQAEHDVAGAYVEAYQSAADAQDAGASLRDIAEAVKGLGHKANKDTVGDWALAAVLTVDGGRAFDAAVAAVFPGEIRRAHWCISAARTKKGQGIAVVRSILAPVTAAIEADDAAADDEPTTYAAAVIKAVKALKSVKAVKEAPKDDDEGEGQGEGEGEGDESELDEPEPFERGAALAKALMGPAHALAQELRNGKALLADEDADELLTALAALAQTVQAARVA